MNKFVIGLLVCAAVAGSTAGVYYGVKYHNMDKNQIEDVSGSVQLINELRDTVKTLTAEKVEFQKQLEKEIAENAANKALVKSLQLNVADLQKTINQLQSVNNADIATINSLNAQIVTLNNQITVLNASIAQSSNKESQLNAKITNLENSISYYEQLLKAYQDETKVIATFKYDGQIYNVQVLTAGGKVSVQSPENTAYKRFVGWKVNGEIVDLATYTLSGDTLFEAEIEYSYDVTFVSDSATVNTQIVKSGLSATLPTPPTKENYVFNGWTLDGNTIVDPTTVTITENTTFIANWAYQYTVQFKIDNTVYSTQKVVRNTFAENVEYTGNKDFQGWSLDGVNVVDVTTVPICEDTTFVAVFAKWETVFTGSKNVVSNNNVSMADLTTSSKFKVTLSELTLQTKFQSGIMPVIATHYCYSNGSTYKFGSVSDAPSGDNIYYTLTLEQNSTVTLVFKDHYSVEISVKCLENGILTISYTVKNANSGYKELYVSKLNLTKVEIYR